MTIKVARVDGVQIPAAQDRRALHGQWSTGIYASGDGLVAAQASPNMTVQVAAITGLLIDDGVSFGNGLLCFESDASANVTIATADATNPRIDLVVAKVTAVEFGGADAFTLERVAGTPAASPAAPAVPTRCYALAEVRVEAGITTIQANKITDRRSLATLAPLARVGCRLYKAVSAVGSGSATAISWSNEDQDTDGFIATPGTTVTIPAGKGGVYAITGYTIGSVTGRSFVELVPTSTLAHVPSEFRNPMDPAEDRGIISVNWPLAAGDSFIFRVFHSTGSSVSFESYLSAFRITV